MFFENHAALSGWKSSEQRQTALDGRWSMHSTGMPMQLMSAPSKYSRAALSIACCIAAELDPTGYFPA